MMNGIKCEMRYNSRYGGLAHLIRVLTKDGDLPHLQYEWQEYTIYPGHDERLTREECWQELRGAIEAAREAFPSKAACVAILPRHEGGWQAIDVNKTARLHFANGRDPVTACNELAADAKPSRPDPEEMSADECKREIDETDDAFLGRRRKRNGDTEMALIVGDTIVGIWSYGTHFHHLKQITEEGALRAAVRALREHLDEEAA